MPGAVLTTADLPDNADQATVSGTLTVLVPNGTTARQIALKAGIRSGENDGTGASDPAGQAGLVAMTASMVGTPGTSSVGGGHISATQLPLSSAPNAMLGGLPVYDIPGKSALATASPNPFSFPDDADDRADRSGEAPEPDRDPPEPLLASRTSRGLARMRSST